MMSWGGLRRRLVAPVPGRLPVAVADVLFAVVLSAFAVASAAGLEGSNAQRPNAGGPAAVAVLVMTAPVLLARRWPVAVSAVLAAGAGLNGVLIGPLVRCGTGLVAVFYTAFVIGARCRNRAAVLGLVLLAVDIVGQAFSDPQLGPGVIAYMVPIAVAFAAAGRLVAARNAVVAQLRARSAELRAQREENARLAVATEHARIAGDLDGFLTERIHRITTAAAAGPALLAGSPEKAREAFETISRSGRSALTRMRDVVAGLHDGGEPAGTGPAPVLARLDRLLADAGEGPARLHVAGDPRLLPPGLELSAYRIVERLLEATDPDGLTDERVEVTVAFGPHDLQLTVAGPARPAGPAGPRGAVRAALAAASERAAVHGGRLQTLTADRRRTTVVTLPLIAGTP
jgi:signal transduction histidine kinase